MSKGNRRSVSALGRSLALLCVVLACSSAAFAQAPNRRVADDQGRSAASQEQERPPSPASEVEQPYAADYERACTRPLNPNEADLCQQWRTANAAEESAAIADRQFWATVAEGGLLLVSVVFTAIAAWAAAEASRAAHGSVEISKQAVALAKRELKETNRPRPRVQIGSARLGVDDATLFIECYLVNKGERIGVIEKVTCDAAYVGGKYMPPLPNQVRTHPSRNTRAISVDTITLDVEAETNWLRYERNERLTQDQVNDIARGKDGFLFFFGTVIYRDHLNDEREIGFCFDIWLWAKDVARRDHKRVGGNTYDYDRPIEPN